MSPVFRPPATRELARTPDPQDWFWSKIKAPMTGDAVLKINGAYVTRPEPSSADIASAERAYLAGYVYQIDAAAAEELVAAGFEVEW